MLILYIILFACLSVAAAAAAVVYRSLARALASPVMKPRRNYYYCAGVPIGGKKNKTIILCIYD